MSLICVVIFFLCDGVCLLMCLCYGLCVLFVDRFHWIVLCAVTFGSCRFLFLVCMCCLWCVVLLFVVSSVRRACLRCRCRLVFVLFLCYGLNTFPVCDCMLCVPYLRCSSLFV